MVETDLSFATFTGAGIRAVRTGVGESLLLECDAEAEEWNLFVELVDPNGEVLWHKSIQVDEEETLEMVLEQHGRYAISKIGVGE